MLNSFAHVPPGFRFHPTDEELVDYYLRKKVTSRRIDLDVIKDVDLYKIEPWDLQELCRIGTEEQNEWYFFSHKDKKYPTGTRTNRATAAGFWKATGRDKAIYSKHDLIGMRKTLVFYKGRAPNGLKSDWIMHEYRLESDPNGTGQEEGWVVCRVFKKRIATTTMRRESEHDSPIWYDDNHVSFMPQEMDTSPHSHHHHQQPSRSNSNNNNYNNNNQQQFQYRCKKELDHNLGQFYPSVQLDHSQFLQLPLLETPKILPPGPIPSFHVAQSSNPMFEHHQQQQDHVTDWRVLDKFVASQLSQEEVSKGNNSNNNNSNVNNNEEYSHAHVASMFQASDDANVMQDNNNGADTSASSVASHIDLWK